MGGAQQQNINPLPGGVIPQIIEAVVIGAAEGEALGTFAEEFMALPLVLRGSGFVGIVDGDVIVEAAPQAQQQQRRHTGHSRLADPDKSILHD